MRGLCPGEKTKSKKEEAKVCTGLSSTLCTPHTTRTTQGPPISLTETRTDFSLSHIDFFFLYITDLLVTSIKCLLPVHTEALKVSSTLGVQWAALELLLEPAQQGQVTHECSGCALPSR